MAEELPHWDPALDKAEEQGYSMIEKVEIAIERGLIGSEPMSWGRSGTVTIVHPKTGQRYLVDVDLNWRLRKTG